MAEKKRLIYADNEIELIKEIFADNEFLLVAVRKLFFGVDISESEKKLIKTTFAKDEVVKLLQRKVFSLNNYETPVGQLSDFWLGVESQIFGASKETIKQAVESKKKVYAMFVKAFDLLKNPDGEKVDISIENMEIDELGINLLARNLYMMGIENGLNAMNIIAGKKEETLEQTLQRIRVDSAK